MPLHISLNRSIHDCGKWAKGVSFFFALYTFFAGLYAQADAALTDENRKRVALALKRYNGKTILSERKLIIPRTKKK